MQLRVQVREVLMLPVGLRCQEVIDDLVKIISLNDGDN